MVMNKKGSGVDMLLFIIFAFIIVLFSGVFIYMGTHIEDKLHETMDPLADATVNHTAIIDDTFGDVPTAFSALYWISVLIIVGMIISIFIGSYLVTTKPVFFIPYFITMIIAIVISVGISNAYEEIATDATLGATYAGFTGANFFLSNLPIWVTIVGFIGAIIMFARMGSKEDQLYYG